MAPRGGSGRGWAPGGGFDGGRGGGHIGDAAETEFVDSSWKQDSADLARNASFPTI